MMEFTCGGEKLLSAMGFGRVPLIGEHVVLSRGGSEKRYRVRDVAYRYEMPPEDAIKAAAADRSIGRESPLPPLLPALITVDLDEE